MKRIIWSKEETNQVAKEYARRFPERKPTWGFIASAQIVLPIERRKRTMMCETLDEFRERVAEIIAAVDANEDSTQKSIDNHLAPPPPIQPAEEAPLRETARLLSPPITRSIPTEAPKTAIPSQSSGTVEFIIDRLIAINQETLAMGRLSANELIEATRNRTNFARIRNLAIQASNSLTLFEELLRVAEEN